MNRFQARDSAQLASAGIAGVGILLASAISVGIHMSSLNLPFEMGTWGACILAAVLAGGVAAAGGYLAMQRHTRQAGESLRHLHDNIRRAFECDDEIELLGLSDALVDIAVAVNERLASLQESCQIAMQQRRGIELKLRVVEQQRRHLEAILDALDDAVLVTDSFNEIAIVNDSAARWLGFDSETALHKTLSEVLKDERLLGAISDAHKARDMTLRRHFEHRVRGSKLPEGQENTSRGALMGDQFFHVTLGCVSSAHEGSRQHDDEKSDRHGVVAILRDITKDKAIAEMKTDFVSSVSHELRTPLASIKAYVEMLIDGEANDEGSRAEFYDIIQSESNRLSRLIDNILSISRIESGVVKIHREDISLTGLIKEALDVVMPQAQAKKIELSAKDTPLFFKVHCDRDMILQALINLMSNAVKYTPQNGTVEITQSVDEYDQLVEVAVKDSGVGIPEEDLPRLFNKFFRVKSNSGMAKGTGLGLNLVKHVVEAVHGGKVSVTSTVGTGSTFIISLPLSRS